MLLMDHILNKHNAYWSVWVVVCELYYQSPNLSPDIAKVCRF